MGDATMVKTSTMRVGLFGWLGIFVGVLMPLISALIYTVYMHQMQPA